MHGIFCYYQIIMSDEKCAHIEYIQRMSLIIKEVLIFTMLFHVIH